MPTQYISLSDYLKGRYGERVYKVSLDAGFTCPNRDGTKGGGGCVYCDTAALASAGCAPDGAGESIASQLHSGMEKVRKRHKADKFIAYFQINTNTYGPVEHLRKIYYEAIGNPAVVGIAVSTRPDCVCERVLDLLREIKTVKDLWLELGLQSANDRTLEAIGRGHSAAEFEDAVLRARDRDIDVCAHVILGLPGEGKDEMMDTARFVAGLPVWGIKFHQLQVVKGTPLELMYNRGEVAPLSLEDYSDLVVECLEILPRGIVVHRLCGDVPERFLVAPRWGENKFMIIRRITDLLDKRRAAGA